VWLVIEFVSGGIGAGLGTRGLGLDLETLRPCIVERVQEMRSAFEGEPESAREALRTLLGTRPLRVGPDPDRGFRVEGLFILPLETRAPWGHGTARVCDSVVAGGDACTCAGTLPGLAGWGSTGRSNSSHGPRFFGR
jgi:hypothetical protein